MSGKSSEQTQETGKKNKKIIIAGVLIIIALLAVIIVLLMGGKKEEPQRNVVVTRDNVDEVVDEMLDKEYVEPGYYSASMNNVWHFAAGNTPSEDAFIENVEENTHDVYFDVFLADDEEKAILESPVLPRGSELKEITLDIPLDAGTYDCIMVYHLIDKDQNTVGTLRVGLTIVVEK